jgi:hypothetical protein
MHIRHVAISHIMPVIMHVRVDDDVRHDGLDPEIHVRNQVVDHVVHVHSHLDDDEDDDVLLDQLLTHVSTDLYMKVGCYAFYFLLTIKKWSKI